MMFVEPVSEVTVTWYDPYGHGQGLDCQFVGLAAGVAFPDCEGGTQNTPDRSRPDAGSSHGGIV